MLNEYAAEGSSGAGSRNGALYGNAPHAPVAGRSGGYWAAARLGGGGVGGFSARGLDGGGGGLDAAALSVAATPVDPVVTLYRMRELAAQQGADQRLRLASW